MKIEFVNAFSELRTVCGRCKNAQNILAVVISKPGSKVQTVGNILKHSYNPSVNI